MTIAYAQASDLLEALVAARTAYDGDAWTALFTPEGELVPDPFEPAVAGHNALRAYLLDAAAAEQALDLTVERHWVSGSMVLAAWHASWIRRRDGTGVRQAGFLSAEVGEDGRIVRLRQWTVTREHLAG